MLRLLLPLLFIATAAAAPVASAQREPPAPKPESYLCPDAFNAGRAVDCFLNAVEHLYTMCRQVKSIEIIEFGYEKSDDGVNAAKSTYCVDKHKPAMTRLYIGATREAKYNKTASEELKVLHDWWIRALAELKWRPGESDEQYKVRIAQPYETFREHATLVRTALDNQGKVKAVEVKPAEAKSADTRAKPSHPKPGAAKPKATASTSKSGAGN
jgi:hypothetical protein